MDLAGSRGGERVKISEVVGVDEVAPRLRRGLNVDCVMDAASLPSGLGAEGDGGKVALCVDFDDLEEGEYGLLDESENLIGVKGRSEWRTSKNGVELYEAVCREQTFLIAVDDAVDRCIGRRVVNMLCFEGCHQDACVEINPHV